MIFLLFITKVFEEMAKKMKNRGKFDRNADDGDR